MLLRLSLILAIIIFIYTKPSAQNCNLSYTLSLSEHDEITDASYAQLKDVLSGNVYTCDAQGYIVLQALCPGTYTFLLHHYACRDTVFMVHLTMSKVQTLQLSHYLHMLHDVHVTANRTEHNTLLFTHTLSASDVYRHQASGIAAVLAQAPGISEVKNGPGISKVMIHGMQGYRVLMLQEGMRFESQAWGNDHAPEMDAFLMTQIEVVKGAASVRYGSDAIGGVVLLRSPQLPDTGQIHGSAQLQYTGNGRMPAGAMQIQGHADAKGHIAWRLHTSGKYGGTVSAPLYAISNTGQHEGNMALQSAYHNTRWGTEIFVSRYNSALGLFSGSHLATMADLKAAIASSVPLQPSNAFSYQFEAPSQDVQHDFIKNAWHWHINDTWQLNTSLALQNNLRAEFDSHTRSSALKPAASYRLQGYQHEVVIEHQQWHGVKGQMGIQYAAQQNNAWGSSYMPNYIQHNGGLFALERMLVFKTAYGPALLEIGSRLDYRTLQTFFYKSNSLQEPFHTFLQNTAQIGLQIPTGLNGRLLCYIGSAWRPPSALELYANGLHHGVGAYEIGNSVLNSEKVINFQIHWTAETDRFHWESQMYYNGFLNYLYLYPSQKFALTLRGAYPIFEYAQTQAAIYGIDVLQRFKIHRTILNTTQITFVRGQDIRKHEPLIYMPADCIKSDIQWLKAYSHASVLMACGAQWVNRQWRLPATGDFAPAPQAYTICYVNTEYTFSWASKRLSCGMQIQNLFNKTYRSYLDRFRYFTDALGRSVNMQLRLHF